MLKTLRLNDSYSFNLKDLYYTLKPIIQKAELIFKEFSFNIFQLFLG